MRFSSKKSKFSYGKQNKTQQKGFFIMMYLNNDRILTIAKLTKTHQYKIFNWNETVFFSLDVWVRFWEGFWCVELACTGVWITGKRTFLKATRGFTRIRKDMENFKSIVHCGSPQIFYGKCFFGQNLVHLDHSFGMKIDTNIIKLREIPRNNISIQILKLPIVNTVGNWHKISCSYTYTHSPKQFPPILLVAHRKKNTVKAGIFGTVFNFYWAECIFDVLRSFAK